MGDTDSHRQADVDPALVVDRQAVGGAVDAVLRALHTLIHGEVAPVAQRPVWLHIEGQQVFSTIGRNLILFREITFTNPVRLHGSMNPDFFKGTVVEKAAAEVLRG